MVHYVCTGGCGAESAEPGFCQDESCQLYGAPMTECDCVDGNHDEVMSASDLNSAAQNSRAVGGDFEGRNLQDINLDELSEYNSDEEDGVRL